MISKNEAYEMGAKAYNNGDLVETNPFLAKDINHEFWLNGWCDQCRTTYNAIDHAEALT